MSFSVLFVVDPKFDLKTLLGLVIGAVEKGI
jgi:hypothetical protein